MWGYQCTNDQCLRYPLTPENNSTAKSLALCRLSCSENHVGTVWPIPTGVEKISDSTVKFNPKDIMVEIKGYDEKSDLWLMAKERFIDMQQRKIPNKSSFKTGGFGLHVEVALETNDMSKTNEKKGK